MIRDLLLSAPRKRAGGQLKMWATALKEETLKPLIRLRVFDCTRWTSQATSRWAAEPGVPLSVMWWCRLNPSQVNTITNASKYKYSALLQAKLTRSGQLRRGIILTGVRLFT